MARPTSTVGVQSPEEFLRTARAGTQKYHDLSTAIADGYRLVGDDFPSLGEHWIDLTRVAADSMRADAPPMLIYIRVGDNPVLAGVAYTRVLKAGDPYPSYPAPPIFWHEHNGSVAEASVPIAHDHHDPAAGTRLAILHAWIWRDNPDGVWAADNWALPFTRLGLQADSASGAAARAASLTSDGADFYSRTFIDFASLSRSDADRVRATIEDASIRAAALTRSASHGRLSRDTVRQLAQVWVTMCESVNKGVSPTAAKRLSPLLDNLLR